MAYVVTESCIRCKYMDCVETCPVACFAAGAVMLVIDPDRRIDCGLCEPTCPANAIVHESDPRAPDWQAINSSYAATWPRIVRKGESRNDADTWNGRSDKGVMFSEKPANAAGACTGSAPLRRP